MHSVSSETVAHTLFGGIQTKAESYNKFQIEIEVPSKHQQNKLNFVFLDQERICGSILHILKELLLKELRMNRLWIWDLGTGSLEIEILIGNDIYGQLLTGRMKQLKSDLTAIETKIGWMICVKIESPS